MSLDFPLEIRQPHELRDMLRKMAARALQLAGDETS
jgi:hypothetical protein